MNLKNPSFFLILTIVVVLLLWETVFWLKLLDPFLFPSPIEVLVSLFYMVFGWEIGSDLLNTLFKVGVSVIVGSMVGFGIGFVLFWWAPLYDAISPLLDFFRSIPATALFPLFLLFFGIGDPTNLALAIWICGLYLSLHVSKGLRQASENRILMAKVLKKSDLDILLHVRLREALPVIFVGLRTAVSLAVMVIIVTEMFVGTRFGIGKVLIDASYAYNIPRLYAGIVLIGVIGYLLNQLVIFSEQRIVHWQGK